MPFPTFLATALPHSRPWCSLELPSHCPVTQRPMASSMWSFLTILLLSQCGSSLSPHMLLATVLLSLEQIHHSLPLLLFHLYLLCLFPKFHSPIICTFSFFSLSLLLWTPHYPISGFLILSPISHCLSSPNLPLFTASLHLLLPFANLHFFFTLMTSIKPCIVSLSGVLIPNVEKMLREMSWLTAECMWHISHFCLDVLCAMRLLDPKLYYNVTLK